MYEITYCNVTETMIMGNAMILDIHFVHKADVRRNLTMKQLYRMLPEMIYNMGILLLLTSFGGVFFSSPMLA